MTKKIHYKNDHRSLCVLATNKSILTTNRDDVTCYNCQRTLRWEDTDYVYVPPRITEIYRLKFGIAPHTRKHSLREIGKIFDVTGSRILQLLKRYERQSNRAKNTKRELVFLTDK